ncbi:hypothetical protein CCUS01_01445, partial [Colletotrichum cuscutae]
AKIFTRFLIYYRLKLALKIKERGFKIAIPYSFYRLLGRRYKILEGKLRYYECIYRSRSYDATISTIYDRKSIFFFYKRFYLY